MSRSRTNQLLKIEKENENKDIKTKHKTVQSKGLSSVLSYATTNNYERNSQFLEKHSSKNIAGKSKSFLISDAPHCSYQQAKKNQLTSTANLRNEHYAESMDAYAKSSSVFRNHKQYMAPTPGPKPRLGQKQVKPQRKNVVLPPFKGKNYHEDELSLVSGMKQEGSVLELFTQRNSLDAEESSSDLTKHTHNNSPDVVSIAVSKRLRSPRQQPISAHSDTHSRRSCSEKLSTCSDSTTYLNLELDLCSLGSPSSEGDIYHMAPLLSAPNTSTSMSADSSSSLERKFRDVLDISRSSMIDEDIKVVKNVLKTDERHELLKTRGADPSLFKDVLKSQLEEIIRNEKVIKIALKKLSTSSQTPRSSTYETAHMVDLISLHQHDLSCRSTARKPKRKHTSFQIDSLSDDSSPERRPRSCFEVEEVATFSHSENADSFKRLKGDFEKRYAYTQKDSGRSKYKTRARSVEAQKEYEKFLKHTLPLKRRECAEKQLFQSAAANHECQVLDIPENSVQTPKSPCNGKPQVNVTFRNVATLEKEILILRALGERLEASLKRTVSEPSLSDLDKQIQEAPVPSNSMTSLTKEIKRIDSSIEVYPGRCTSVKSFVIVRLMTAIPWQERRVGFVVFAKGLRHQIGIVEEYMIVSKTIDELRCDASSSFYISKSGHMERTSFEKLKTEPQILLQNLRPKIAGQAFNLLDHDPMFFNSLLRPAIKVEKRENVQLKAETSRSYAKENMIMHEGGDSKVAAAEGLKRAVKKIELKTTAKRSRPVEKKRSGLIKETHQVQAVVERKQKPQKEKEQPKEYTQVPLSATFLQEDDSSAHSTIGLRRSRIRRMITPMPFDAFDEPKNNLLKKVLIGVIQVSVFMGLIMALTLPDIKC